VYFVFLCDILLPSGVINDDDWLFYKNNVNITYKSASILYVQVNMLLNTTRVLQYLS